MKPVLGRMAGLALLEAIGIPSDGVRSIELHCRLNEAAYVTVERFVNHDEITSFTSEVKEWTSAPGRWEEKPWTLYEKEDGGTSVDAVARAVRNVRGDVA